MRTAKDFIRRLLEVDPRSPNVTSPTRSVTHGWILPLKAPAAHSSQPSALARYTVGRSLSDVSELSGGR